LPGSELPPGSSSSPSFGMHNFVCGQERFS
jgi:hypothetical protein